MPHFAHESEKTNDAIFSVFLSLLTEEVSDSDQSDCGGVSVFGGD